MSDVHLISEMFSSVDSLSEILQDRQIPFICSDNISADVGISSSKCQTLIISDQYYKKVGNDALISFAKTLRASQICAVSEKQPEFGITSELGGKMIFLRLPIQESENISEDYGLQMLATLVSNSGVVAASDESSQKLFNLAKRVANTDVTVFINGPTGTGKEVLSKFIHNNSKRNEAGFIAVNCAAIPENMLEAILFGYEKGSFTGASTTNKGIFRAADNGTLATTNRNMDEEIRNGNFREDLYYRLNVFPLSTLSLADRTSDIIAISTVLIKKHCDEIESIPFLAKSALNLLVNYTWPGNVRELENVIQRALVLSDGKTISAEDIIIDDTLYQGGGQAHIQNMLEKQAIAG